MCSLNLNYAEHRFLKIQINKNTYELAYKAWFRVLNECFSNCRAKTRRGRPSHSLSKSEKTFQIISMWGIKIYYENIKMTNKLSAPHQVYFCCFRFFSFRFRLWQQLNPDITSTCWQHLNLASVWNSGRLSADYMNGVKRCLNTSNSLIRTTCVFPPQLRGWNVYVLLVYSQSCSSP